MGRRSFAGYACEESLSIGLFGECFRAKNKAGDEARVVVVDSRLAKRKRFASALARHGTKLSNLVHPHLVTTQTVGRGKDGSLVVIASPVKDPIELAALLERTEGMLPRDVALSIAMGALEGLSHAHEHNVTHGGVHPRSVIVNGKGVAKLADLGLARALASAAAAAEDSELLRGLRGYVAPELALGQEPNIESDVFSAGALVCQLLWGEPTPPDDEKSPLVTILKQATDTDTKKRFANAGMFEKELRRAISDGKIDVAKSSRVGDYILRGESARSDSVLDSETEDLLNSLGIGGQPEVEGPRQSTTLEEVLANMGAEFEGVEDESSPGTPAPEPVKATPGTTPPADDAGVDADAAAEDQDEDDEDDDTHVAEADYEEDCTEVESQVRMAPADAVEAVLRASTPAPAEIDPFVRAKSVHRAPLQDYDVPDDTPLPRPRPFHADHTHVNALVDLVGRQAATSLPFDDAEDRQVKASTSLEGAGGRKASTSSPFDDEEDLPVEVVKRSNTLRLLAVIAFVFATLVAVAYTKTDLLKLTKKEGEASQAEAMAKAEKMQPVAGELMVLSKTEDAAVWLLLGRTPMKSFVLPSSMIHELRIQHEGFAPEFLSVAEQHWSGQDSERQATIAANLSRQSTEKLVTLPAFPPIAVPPLPPGGPGQGKLAVDSTPSGAEVWMLVGSTPIMNLVGIEAGKDYTFKVLKDGYLPATASFKAEDWYLTGTSGPVKPSLVQQLVLEPLPKASEGGSALPRAPGNDDASEGSKDAQDAEATEKARPGSKKRR